MKPSFVPTGKIKKIPAGGVEMSAEVSLKETLTFCYQTIS